MTPRERALSILTQVRRQEAFAAPLLDREREGDDRDRRFVRTLVLGVLRWRSQLDWLIEQVAGRKTKSFDPLTLDILRLGFYQLLYTDVPAHAAVGESVQLAQKRIARSKAAVNAILRRASNAALRELLPVGDSIEAVAVRTAHPEWMLRRWSSRFGAERAAAIAAANQELSEPDLLVNLKKISRDELLATIRARGVEADASPLHSALIRMRGSTTAVEDELRAGLVYAMDEGSAAVALAVSPSAKSVLDLAAAPGGKSLVLRLRGQQVISHDVSFRRLLPLRISSGAVLGAAQPTVVGDGRALPFRRRFDAVLLDAPCSATGTIRRNPEIKWRLKEADLEQFATLQRELLDSALNAAEQECVYATCSLEGEENEAVIAEIIRRHPRFRLADAVVVEGSSRDNPLHLTPERGTDGFTIHVLTAR